MNPDGQVMVLQALNFDHIKSFLNEFIFSKRRILKRSIHSNIAELYISEFQYFHKCFERNVQKIGVNGVNFQIEIRDSFANANNKFDD